MFVSRSHTPGSGDSKLAGRRNSREEEESGAVGTHFGLPGIDTVLQGNATIVLW